MGDQLLRILLDYMMRRINYQQAQYQLAQYQAVLTGTEPLSYMEWARQLLDNYIVERADGTRVPSEIMYRNLWPAQQEQVNQELGLTTTPTPGPVPTPTPTPTSTGGVQATATPQPVGNIFAEAEAQRRAALPQANIFEQFLARQFPGQQQGLQEAAFGLLPGLQTEFNLLFPSDVGLDVTQGAPFMQFLQSGRRLQGQELTDQLRALADIVPLSFEAFQASPFYAQPETREAQRNLALYEFFGPEAPPERQFDPFILAATQGASAAARDLLTNAYSRLFRRQQYETPFQPFLDYARRARLGGVF